MPSIPRGDSTPGTVTVGPGGNEYAGPYTVYLYDTLDRGMIEVHFSRKAYSLSSSPVRNAQKGATDEILRRSLGLWTSTIWGPKEISCMPGYFSPITPHSRPACMATSSGTVPSFS